MGDMGRLVVEQGEQTGMGARYWSGGGRRGRWTGNSGDIFSRGLSSPRKYGLPSEIYSTNVLGFGYPWNNLAPWKNIKGVIGGILQMYVAQGQQSPYNMPANMFSQRISQVGGCRLGTPFGWAVSVLRGWLRKWAWLVGLKWAWLVVSCLGVAGVCLLLCCLASCKWACMVTRWLLVELSVSTLHPH